MAQPSGRFSPLHVAVESPFRNLVYYFNNLYQQKKVKALLAAQHTVFISPCSLLDFLCC